VIERRLADLEPARSNIENVDALATTNGEAPSS
jgi:hypothetical protein